MADLQAPRRRYRSICRQRPVGRVCVPSRRHRDQHPTEERHHLDADAVRAVDLRRTRLPGAARRGVAGLDICTRPLAAVTAALAAQTHRRFIKTHAPLDGLPLHADVTYLVVGRDPRDVMISWEHHAANMDFARLLALRAAAVGKENLAELPAWHVPFGDPVERLPSFVADETSWVPPTLASVLHHLDTGWQHRRDPNVALFHYADLTADLAGELLRLAGVLGIPCSPERARELAPEASLERMRERAVEVAPGAPQARLKDTRAFFRSGGTGEWCACLSAADLAAYEARVAELVDPELAAWAHSGRLASGIDPEG